MKIQHENIRSIDVKQEALDDIYAHFDAFHKNTVFGDECRSWFKDGKIKNRIYLWPGPVCACQPTPPSFFPFSCRHRAATTPVAKPPSSFLPKLVSCGLCRAKSLRKF